MYPEKLESEKGNEFFYDADYFEDSKLKYIHTYLHGNYKFKMHSHQFYEMNIIMGGEGRHYIAETSLPVRVGDVFVIPPEIPHGYYSEGSLDIYHILIKSDFLERYAEELRLVQGYSILFDIEPYIRRSSGRNFNLNIGKELSRVQDELDTINKAESKGSFIRQNALTLAFICRLCERITKTVSSGKENLEIIKVMEFIKDNIDKKLTLDYIAAFANMSKATLNRHFKEIIGESPMNYVLTCRITRAREMLSAGERSKTEIAQLCGFYDTAHMNKYV